MDEYRTWCGQGGRVDKRLVGKEQSYVRAHLERLEAETARAIPRGRFSMGGVTVLGRLHGCPSGGRDGVGDALNSIGAHISVGRELYRA